LHKDDTKYRSFFENSADAMLIIENGEFVDCNSATVSMLGYGRKEELINTPPFKLSPEFQPDGSSSFDKADEMMRLARERGNHRFEWDHLRKDGSIIPVEVSLTAIESSHGNSLHTIWRDITNRKEDEKAIRDSEHRFRHMFEANPDPVVLAVLEDGRIIDVNVAFEKMTGITRLEAIGHNSADLGLWANEENRKPFLDHLQIAGEVNNLEADFRVSGGHIKAGLLSARLISVNDERCILIVIRDISTEKKAERALIAMDQMKNEFISTAAHELRTPIASIMGYTELLSDIEFRGSFTEEQKQDFHHEIHHNSERLAKIIDEIFDVSLIESGQSIPLEMKPTSISGLLEKIVNRFNMTARQNIILDVSSEIPKTIKIDPSRITQVIENLLSNSIKYSPSNSDISISVEKAERFCVFSVIDQGIGMNEEQKARIFDKFYRADGSDTAVRGLGLGMNIVKQIIEEHDGSIWVDSAKGEGTKVYFKLHTGKKV